MSLTQRCLANTCALATSCLSIGSADVELTEKLVEWSLELVERAGEEQLVGVLRLLQEATARAAVGSSDAWIDVYSETVLLTFVKVLSWLNSNADTIEAGGEVATDLKKEVGNLLKIYAKKGTMGDLGEQCLEDLVEVIVVMVTKQVADIVQESREVEVSENVLYGAKAFFHQQSLQGRLSTRPTWRRCWCSSPSCGCCRSWSSSWPTT